MNKILFFAQLRERLDCAELSIDAAGLTVLELREKLANTSECWQLWVLDKDVLVAVNQSLALSTQKIAAGDEIAMFPPVTGG